MEGRALKPIQEVVLIIPGDAAELSPNRRIGRYKKAGITRRWRKQAAIIAALEIRWPPQPRRVRLSWLIRRGRELDPAQLHGSGCLKAIEDGLVDARVMPDDAPKWVEWGLVQQEASKGFRLHPHIVVTITVIEEGEE